MTDYSSPNRIISAVRFGGYPEVVKAMSDDLRQEQPSTYVQTVRPCIWTRFPGLPKAALPRRHVRCGHSYGQRRRNLDQLKEDTAEDDSSKSKPRKCYIFCPAGDRLLKWIGEQRLRWIPEFRDYVLQELIRRETEKDGGILRQGEDGCLGSLSAAGG